MTHILLRHREIPEINQLSVYQKNGGLAAFKNAVTTMKTTEVIDVVKNSGLRGRGGAGFPTGMKWSFADNKNWPHYVVANADESEPGTFKDREIMEGNPLQFLEGVMIGSYAVGANAAYIYLRGEFWEIAESLDAKIAELEERLTSEANEMGIGPMGFGGQTTVLDTKIVGLSRLPASYFVSVSYMCWAYRRRKMTVKGEEITYD
jgi:NADH-quinone oxidoreductase subunit F